jgi:hypothetical protein
MSQSEHPVMRGVAQLDEKIDKLAEVVSVMAMRDDERQRFTQQIEAVESEIRQLRISNNPRERFIKPRKIKPYDGESQTLQSFLTAIELQMENDGVTEGSRKNKVCWKLLYR